VVEVDYVIKNLLVVDGIVNLGSTSSFNFMLPRRATLVDLQILRTKYLDKFLAVLVTLAKPTKGIHDRPFVR
jgi:hypothetical protein